MSSYLGYHAQLYDLFYAKKDYASEAQFVHQLSKKFSLTSSNSILELACGTGNHALALEKLGYHLTATDYSKDMLMVAKKKAEQQKSNILFKWADMRALPTFTKKFDTILCLFDSIGYVQTNEAILDVLIGVHRNLKQKGLFIFEFWHAAAMLKHFEPYRERDFRISANHTIHRVSETTLDIKQQTARVQYKIDEIKDHQIVNHLEETQHNRFFQVQEMRLFLNQVGFELMAVYDGFQHKAQIDDQTWHIVAVAQRK